MENKRPTRKFNDKESFWRKHDKQEGVVVYLRNDSHEKIYSHANYYHVDFLNNTFDTYFPETLMLKYDEVEKILKTK